MKYPQGTEVYLLPILDWSRTHFHQDEISTVKGTYFSMYGGNPKTQDKEYCLECGAWYPEDTLIPTNGRTLEECREQIIPEVFAVDYKTIVRVMSHLKQNDPLMLMLKEGLEKTNV